MKNDMEFKVGYPFIFNVNSNCGYPQVFNMSNGQLLHSSKKFSCVADL